MFYWLKLGSFWIRLGSFWVRFLFHSSYFVVRSSLLDNNLHSFDFLKIGFVLHKKGRICSARTTSVEGKIVKSELKCLKCLK